VFALLVLVFGVIAAPAQSTPTNSALSDKELAAQLVQTHRNNLVFIKGKTASGSGFIANSKGKKTLITNTHVMAGIKGATFELLDRTPVRVGSASAAMGHDLVAFVVTEGGTGIPTADSVDTEAKIGDAVVVLGNALGGGVVNTIQGELTGIGPDRIEVSAPFEMGNSGSPIIHLASGKVIGVATYAKQETLLSGAERLRRFGYRLDSVKGWQLIEWNRFYAESDATSGILKTTLELNEIFSDFEGATTRNSFRRFETPAIRNALDIYGRSIERSPRERNNAAVKLLGSLKDTCKSDITTAKARFTYDYFRRELDRYEVMRGEYVKVVDRALKQ
jgi:hypothetical protein